MTTTGTVNGWQFRCGDCGEVYAGFADELDASAFAREHFVGAWDSLRKVLVPQETYVVQWRGKVVTRGSARYRCR